MKENEQSGENEKNPKKKTLLGAFLAREEPDEDYIPDLKDQWEMMNRSQRFIFIIGAVIGLLLISAALLLVYLIIIAMKS